MKSSRFSQGSAYIIWMAISLFALLPLLCLALTSLLPDEINEPTALRLTLENYQAVLSPIYRHLIIKSALLGVYTTLICLLIAYPYALALSTLPKQSRGVIMLLTIVPFWTSSLLRTYAIMTILKTHGLLNKLLINMHLIKTPMLLLFTKTAVLIGLVYNLLPFMILPIYHNIESLDNNLLDAAYDLGASTWQSLIKIIVPLTLPGIISGCTMTFLPAITLFYIPDLLGGAKSMLLGNLIQYEFLTAQNWPLGSAIGMSLLIAIGCMSVLSHTLQKRMRS